MVLLDIFSQTIQGVGEYFSGMTAYDLTVQAVGLVAMFFCIAAFQAKKRNTILVMQMIGMGMWTLHFLLLGEYAGAAMNGLAVVRAVFYVQREKHEWANSKIIPAVFVALFIGAGLFTWYLGDDMWYLPSIAMTITSIGLFFRNEQTVRKINLFSSPPWIVYNAFAHSVPAVFTESMTMVSVIIALIRYRKKKNDCSDEIASEADDKATDEVK